MPTPIDPRTVPSRSQALAPYPAHPIVRPPIGDPAPIKSRLDIAFDSLQDRTPCLP